MGGWKRSDRVKSRAFAEDWLTHQLQTPLSTSLSLLNTLPLISSCRPPFRDAVTLVTVLCDGFSSCRGPQVAILESGGRLSGGRSSLFLTVPRFFPPDPP